MSEARSVAFLIFQLLPSRETTSVRLLCAFFEAALVFSSLIFRGVSLRVEILRYAQDDNFFAQDDGVAAK
jgi:hypothetical protein